MHCGVIQRNERDGINLKSMLFKTKRKEKEKWRIEKEQSEKYYTYKWSKASKYKLVNEWKAAVGLAT